LFVATDSFLRRNGVKRIIVLSSCAAIREDSKPWQLRSEKDWNEEAIRTLSEQGEKASGGIIYQASKALAEQG
jgi:nucleoside-diphosphate-sugar epimerase